MKEYLCSNFLAAQILSEVAPAHFQSRLGYAATGISKDPTTITIRHHSILYTHLGNSTEANTKVSRSLKTNDIQESMRYDQGSTGYRDWLTK